MAYTVDDGSNWVNGLEEKYRNKMGPQIVYLVARRQHDPDTKLPPLIIQANKPNYRPNYIDAQCDLTVDMFTANVQFSDLERLVKDPKIKRMEAGRVVKPQ